MATAIEKFPEEYALKMKSLGLNFKIYYQKQWNTPLWTQINSTDTFICCLKEQMEVRQNVKKSGLINENCLQMCKDGEKF